MPSGLIEIYWWTISKEHEEPIDVIEVAGLVELLHVMFDRPEEPADPVAARVDVAGNPDFGLNALRLFS